jgi:hypothetical protein
MLLSGASMSSRKSIAFGIDYKRKDCSIAVLFSICDLAVLGDSYNDIYEKGKIKVVSNLKESFGTPRDSYEAISFINCYDLLSENRTTKDSPQKWKTKLDEAISDIEEYFFKVDEEFLENTVYIDIAAYEPFEGLGVALCYALQHTIMQSNPGGRFSDFVDFAKDHYQDAFGTFTQTGWTLTCNYVAHLELMLIYTPTDEEKEELVRIAKEKAEIEVAKKKAEWEEAERQRIAKKQEEHDNNSRRKHLLLAGIAVLGLVIVVAATVACPPAGAAFLAAAGSSTTAATAITIGNGMMLAAGTTSAVLHVAELTYEAWDDDLEAKLMEHFKGAITDALLCLKWGQIIKFLGGSKILGGTKWTYKEGKLLEIKEELTFGKLVGTEQTTQTVVNVKRAQVASDLANADKQLAQTAERIVSRNPNKFKKLGITSNDIKNGIASGSIRDAATASEYGIGKSAWQELSVPTKNYHEIANIAKQNINIIADYTDLAVTSYSNKLNIEGAVDFTDEYIINGE